MTDDELKHLTDDERASYAEADRVRQQMGGYRCTSGDLAAVLESLAATRAKLAAAEARVCRHGWRGSVPERGERIVTPCPTCGSKSLFIGTGGHLTCGNVPSSDRSSGCPQPSPAAAWSNMAARALAAEERERKLREALDWYATSTSGALWQDCGCKARAARAAPSADAGTEPPAEPSATGAGTDEPKEQA